MGACFTMLLCMGGITLRHLKITSKIITHLFPMVVREVYRTTVLAEQRELLQAPEIIEGKLVTLKKFSFKDIEAHHSLIGNPHCTDLFLINSHTTVAPDLDLHQYLYRQLISQFFGSRIVYSVTVNKQGTIEGMVELIRIHDPKTSKFKHYEIAGFARPSQWGTGTAMESVELASHVFFEICKENSLYGYVFPHNYRCQTFLTKCGFNFSHICEDVESKDELVFVLQRDKFTKKKVNRARHQPSR